MKISRITNHSLGKKRVHKSLLLAFASYCLLSEPVQAETQMNKNDLKEREMTNPLPKTRSAIIFSGDKVKTTPPIFDGVTLRSFIHPETKYNDGFSILEKGQPEVRYSFGMFTIKKGKHWPPTRFSISDVMYILEGKAVLEIDGKKHQVKQGDVIYIPPNQVRVIHVVGDQDFKYLSIVDPAWLPEYEQVL